MSESAAGPVTEIDFLRSQVTALSNRLCDTLIQQVAQQQTVLIASMQANLALTQTIERLNKMVDCLSENLEILERDQDKESDEPRAPDFGTLLASLAPYLIGSVTQSKPDSGRPKEPTPFSLPKEITDLMRNHPIPSQTMPTKPNPAPGTPAPTRKAQSKKTKSNS
jgi:hypothetical protein